MLAAMARETRFSWSARNQKPRGKSCVRAATWSAKSMAFWYTFSFSKAKAMGELLPEGQRQKVESRKETAGERTSALLARLGRAAVLCHSLLSPHHCSPALPSFRCRERMVGAPGFEPGTSASRTRRSRQTEPRPDYAHTLTAPAQAVNRRGPCPTCFTPRGADVIPPKWGHVGRRGERERVGWPPL